MIAQTERTGGEGGRDRKANLQFFLFFIFLPLLNVGHIKSPMTKQKLGSSNCEVKCSVVECSAAQGS